MVKTAAERKRDQRARAKAGLTAKIGAPKKAGMYYFSFLSLGDDEAKRLQRDKEAEFKRNQRSNKLKGVEVTRGRKKKGKIFLKFYLTSILEVTLEEQRAKDSKRQQVCRRRSRLRDELTELALIEKNDPQCGDDGFEYSIEGFYGQTPVSG